MMQARDRRAMIYQGSQDSEAAFFEIANIETIVVTAHFSEATRAKFCLLLGGFLHA